MKKSNYIFILISVTVFYSCKTQSFSSRKYTSGNYLSSNKAFNKTQPYELEKTKLLAVNHAKEKSLPFIITEKKSTPTDTPKIKNDFFGDSITVTKTKGKNTVVHYKRVHPIKDTNIITIKKFGVPDVVKKVYFPKEKYVKAYHSLSLSSIFTCIIPLIGIMDCLFAWNRRKKLRKNKDIEYIQKNKILLIIATCISFLYILAALTGFIYLLVTPWYLSGGVAIWI